MRKRCKFLQRLIAGDMGDASVQPELLDLIPPEADTGQAAADGVRGIRRYPAEIAFSRAAEITPPRNLVGREYSTTTRAIKPPAFNSPFAQDHQRAAHQKHDPE